MVIAMRQRAGTPDRAGATYQSWRQRVQDIGELEGVRVKCRPDRSIGSATHPGGRQEGGRHPPHCSLHPGVPLFCAICFLLRYLRAMDGPQAAPPAEGQRQSDATCAGCRAGASSADAGRAEYLDDLELVREMEEFGVADVRRGAGVAETGAHDIIELKYIDAHPCLAHNE